MRNRGNKDGFKKAIQTGTIKKGSRIVIRKGYTSSSNPSANKYRAQAKNFLKKTLNEEINVSNLSDFVNEQDSEDFSEVSSFGSKSVNTNTSFNSLISKCKSDSVVHKDLQETFSTVAEIIKAKGGKETESDYFAAILSLLDAVEKPERIQSLLILLTHILPRISSSLLMKTFSLASKKFLDYLQTFSNSDYGHLVRSTITCLCSYLRAQELAIWQLPITTKVFNSLLALGVHIKPKTRKVAQESIASILIGSNIMTTMSNRPLFHPAVPDAANFCNSLLDGKKVSKTDILHCLGILNRILGTFPNSFLKTTCENILKLVVLGDKITTLTCFKVMNSLFNSHNHLTDELNAQIINALYDYQPPPSNSELIQAWMNVQVSALLSLTKLNNELIWAHLAKFFEVATKTGWKSLNSDVHGEVVIQLQRLLNCALTPLLNEYEGNISQHHKYLSKMFTSVEFCLTVDFQPAWLSILKMLENLYHVFGKHCPEVTYHCLKTLGEIRDQENFTHKAALDHVLGTTIRVLGPQKVLCHLPLEMYHDGITNEFKFPRSWILPLLRENIKEAELGFFIEYFIPLAKKINSRMELAKAEQRLAQFKTFEIILYQIWSLLPGFCHSPPDISKTFKNIVEDLVYVLINSPDHRIFILTSLRSLVKHSLNNQMDISVLSSYTKRIMPTLFDLYLKENLEKNTHLALFETIKMYLEITDEQLRQIYYGNVIKRLKAGEEKSFSWFALLDLARLFVPYISEDHLNLIFEYIKSYLNEENMTAQKKSYRLLEEICKIPSQHCEHFIEHNSQMLVQLFVDTSKFGCISSKAPRLRCLSLFLDKLEMPNYDFIHCILPEAMLCVKESASKVREAGYNFVVASANAFLRWQVEGGNQESLDKLIVLMLAALGGDSYHISTAILCFAKIFAVFRKDISQKSMDSLIDNVCLLMKSDSREVIQSCLTFFKVLLVRFTKIELQPYLGKFIEALGNITSQKMRQFRFKAKEILVKLVRIFGIDMVSPFVPESHQKVLNHIRRIEARKARRRAGLIEDDDDSDSLETQTLDDADNYTNFSMQSFQEIIENLTIDDDEKMTRKTARTIKKAARKNAPKVYIQEDDDVDLEDPSIVTKLLTKKPRQVKVNDNQQSSKEIFKIGPDGKLIITESDDEETNKNRKRKFDETLEVKSKGSQKSRSAKKLLLEDVDSDDDEDFASIAKTYKTRGKSITKSLSLKSGRSQKSKSIVSIGSKYSSKKGPGDCRRHNSLEPYAYIPLERTKKGKIVSTKIKGIFAGAKRGAQRGMSLNRKQKHKLQKHKN